MKFWQELKRRKVIGVIPVYAAIYAMVGEPDLAMGQIEYLLSEPTWLSKTWLVRDIHFNPLNTHSGFQKLISNHEIGQ